MLALLATLLAVVSLREAPSAKADDDTVSQDALRTGWDPNEPNLSPSTVTSSNFGQLFATQVNGQVYAQPLVVGNTLLVSTENDYVYGINATTGAIEWSDNFGPAWPVSTIGCSDLTPNLGNTSAGVYDPSTNTYYLTTKVNNGADVNHPNWYLQAVNATTGVENTGYPLLIQGTPTNDPAHPFIGESVNQRPGLLLMNGSVYMAFGSQCDYLATEYVGYVVGVNTSTKAISIWSDESGASSQMAGIWQGGGGIVSDGTGRLFVSTGNGVTGPDAAGTNPPNQLSQSVIRLGVAANGTMTAQDFFSPSNGATLDTNDQDLGSGGPVGLPSQYFGTTADPHLMVEVGKDGRVFLLNRDSLGGKGQGSGGGDAVLQTLGPYQGVWGHTGVYGGDNGTGGYVYMVQNNNTMLAFKYGTTGSGAPALSLAGNSNETFGYTSGSPIVTSNGTTPGSAVVWVTNSSGPTGTNSQMCAYNAVPTNNILTLLRCFPIGTAVKFATAASSNGRIYTGTRDGYIYGFGQPTTSALTTTQTSFGNVNVGSSASTTVTATATRTVTVTGVATSAPFSAKPPSLPVTLTAGQTISVPVTFTPTAAGSATGTLQYTLTDSGTTETVGAGLQGAGVKAGFSATPASLAFGQVAVGSTESLTVSFANTGVSNETVTSVTAPTAPFTATGLPATGAVLTPGQSVSVSVTYTPTAAENDSSSIAVAGADGTATVPLTGTGVTGQAQLTITPAALNFGTLTVGQSATQTLTVSNTGNLNVTITKAAPPALPFVVNTPLPEGQVLTPGDTIQVQVTYEPTTAGTTNDLYVISSNDGNGAHNIPVTGTAVNPTNGTALPTIGGGWVLNGSAQMSGTSLQLTQAVSNQAGSAIYSTPIPSNGLSASFTAQIGGGTGADGMTFAMLDASANTPQSLGAAGGSMGYCSLPGIAVVLGTYPDGTSANNFVGLATGCTAGEPTYAATSTNIGALRTGTHTVAVTDTSGTVAVTVDGTQVISAAVNVPASVYAAFTGGTGGENDIHAVSAVSVTSGTTTLPQPGAGWDFNGTAAMSSAEAVLTPATNNTAGSVFYSQPVATNGLQASFTTNIGGGTGADGETFALLDPSQDTAKSLGAAGGGLGLSGLAGVGVAFVTYPQGGVNSSNFVGVVTGGTGGALTFGATNTAIPNLRTSTHNVSISITGTTLTVSMDGTQVLNTTVPTLTSTAIVGFTGGCGGLNDVHGITSEAITVPTTGGGGGGTGGGGTHTLPAPGATGWTYNSAASMNGTTLQLTPATAAVAGSAFYGTPISPTNLDAKFTVSIGGGTGADGQTFTLLDSTKAGAKSVGVNGGGLGFSGLPGVAVAFVTYQHTGYPSANFIGISTSAGSTTDSLSFIATATNIPALRTGTHAIEVKAGTAGDLIVSIDGTQVLDTKVTVPASALVGFTGGNGGRYDVHAVSGVTVTY